MIPVLRDNGMTDLELSVLDRKFGRARCEADEYARVMFSNGGTLKMPIFKIKEERYGVFVKEQA